MLFSVRLLRNIAKTSTCKFTSDSNLARFSTLHVDLYHRLPSHDLPDQSPLSPSHDRLLMHVIRTLSLIDAMASAPPKTLSAARI